MFDSKFAERVDYCIYDCRRRTSGAGFATPFEPKRVGRAGCGIAAKFYWGDLVCTRDIVVHKLTRMELSRIVIVCTFEDRLTQTLYHSAMDLPFQKERVENYSEIMNYQIA